MSHIGKPQQLSRTRRRVQRRRAHFAFSDERIKYRTVRFWWKSRPNLKPRQNANHGLRQKPLLDSCSGTHSQRRVPAGCGERGSVWRHFQVRTPTFVSSQHVQALALQHVPHAHRAVTIATEEESTCNITKVCKSTRASRSVALQGRKRRVPLSEKSTALHPNRTHSFL